VVADGLAEAGAEAATVAELNTAGDVADGAGAGGRPSEACGRCRAFTATVAAETRTMTAAPAAA
jgi:hypothetical protein